MCMEYSMKCMCNSREASFNFREEIMPPEVISRVYCPECSREISFDPDSMLADNGWVIEYDMDVARFSALKTPHLLKEELTPALLFDEGYATWRGVYPGDHIDSAREREEIVALARTDPRAYLERIKSWGIKRMERLRQEGWRKANEG
ncbi:MAG: hypothetical protein GXO97_02950 [Nitrospirae bacterium]|nr:hypothetical protein [Nitrospirota bacterium]